MNKNAFSFLPPSPPPLRPVSYIKSTFSFDFSQSNSQLIVNSNTDTDTNSNSVLLLVILNSKIEMHEKSLNENEMRFFGCCYFIIGYFHPMNSKKKKNQSQRMCCFWSHENYIRTYTLLCEWQDNLCLEEKLRKSIQFSSIHF